MPPLLFCSFPYGEEGLLTSFDTKFHGVKVKISYASSQRGFLQENNIRIIVATQDCEILSIRRQAE
jgi:hypothetical protein